MEYLRRSSLKLEEQGGYLNQENVKLASNESLNIIAKNQELLDEITNLATDKEDKKLLIARVFEHSTSDGLKLAEKNNFTNKDYLALLERPQFYLKHADLAKKIVSEADLSAQSDEDKQKIEELKKVYQQYGGDLKTGKYEIFLKKDKVADFKVQKLLNKVDSWYAQFLKNKEFKPIPIESDPRSHAEQLGEEALEQIKLSLEKNYYPGDVMRIVVKHLAKKDEKKITKQAEYIFKKNVVISSKYKHQGFTSYLDKVKKGKESVRELGLKNMREILSEDEMEKVEFGTYLPESIVQKIKAKYGITDKKILKQLEEARYKPLGITFKILTSEAEKNWSKKLMT